MLKIYVSSNTEIEEEEALRWSGIEEVGRREEENGGEGKIEGEGEWREERKKGEERVGGGDGKRRGRKKKREWERERGLEASF